MSDLVDVAKTLGADVVAEVKNSLEEDYENLTLAQKQSIENAAKTYMELQLRAKLGEDVEAKIQAVSSTVRDWKVWGAIGAEQAFWKGVEKVAITFGKFLASAAIGLV